MNSTYQEKPFNPHAHWHLIHRYEKSVEVADLTFKDEEFGYIFTAYKERLIDDDTIDAVAERLKAL